MKLTGDYHTHTVYSHGKGTIYDNALAAKNAGLCEIAISDHGFAHPAFGLTERKVPDMLKDIKNAAEKTGVKVLLGIEANILSESGKTDMKEKFYADFDVYLAGIHKFVMCGVKSAFNFLMPNFFTSAFKTKPSRSLVKRTTAAYINVIKNNPVDAITHVNFCAFADAVEVAKCARDYGTYIELNAKKTHLTDEELYAVANTGVRFIIGSDAHTPERVGEISLVEETLKRVSIDLSQIDNIDGRLPDFRFEKYKEEHGI